MRILVAFIKKHICNTKFGDWVVNQVRIRAIDEKLYDIPMIRQYLKDCKKPTDLMLKTQEYFDENTEEIERNIALLADDESKECYKKAIAYRGSHDRKMAPHYTKNKYFIPELLELTDNEVFIDGGAFVGDTLTNFLKVTKRKYKRVICFEPDVYNFKMLNKIKASNVCMYNVGLWEEKKILSFFNNGSVGSRVDEDSSKDNVINIEVDCIDNVKDCNDATLVKLDVEGSEMKALKGARQTIKKNKPKLIVCLYHSDSDMLDIIKYVHELVPEYKLYVRHHSKFAGETVLYATV